MKVSVVIGETLHGPLEATLALPEISAPAAGLFHRTKFPCDIKLMDGNGMVHFVANFLLSCVRRFVVSRLFSSLLTFFFFLRVLFLYAVICKHL